MSTGTSGRQGTLTERVALEIRFELTRQRLSQAALARQLGVSGMWVSDRLRGVQPIDLLDLERIAMALGVEPVNLVASAEGRTVQMNSRFAAVPERPPGNSLASARRPADNRPDGRPHTGMRRPERVAHQPIAA